MSRGVGKHRASKESGTESRGEVETVPSGPSFMKFGPTRTSRRSVVDLCAMSNPQLPIRPLPDAPDAGLRTDERRTALPAWPATRPPVFPGPRGRLMERRPCIAREASQPARGDREAAALDLLNQGRYASTNSQMMCSSPPRLVELSGIVRPMGARRKARHYVWGAVVFEPPGLQAR
jgi:hypothetical protein